LKSKRLSKKASDLYISGLSVQDVASELGIAYRTARKAILMSGVDFRDSSARLLGRTGPKRDIKGRFVI
jgi:orotate phosphoribosyltransferase-like protein